MARYELVEGKSSKFWDIQIDGRDLVVRFGRIGTNGQSQTKSFADATAAKKEHDKLVREKTSKGYKPATPVGKASEATSAEGVAVGETKIPEPPKPARAPRAAKKAPSDSPDSSVPEGFVAVDNGYALGIEGGKLVCLKNGARLASVPKPLKESEVGVSLLAALEWLARHDAECVGHVESWMLKSLPAPRTMLEAVWVDESWRRALENLVVVPLDASAKPIGETGFFKGVGPRGIGVVDRDGETAWWTAASVGIPHPVMLDGVDDLRSLATELSLTTVVSQLFRETYVPSAKANVDTHRITDYANGKFQQLNHAISRSRKLGFRISGGSAIVRTLERGTSLEARYWVGSDEPTMEAYTGDLVWVDDDDRPVPIDRVTPIAYSEGVRMAASIYAGRATEETAHA